MSGTESRVMEIIASKCGVQRTHVVPGAHIVNEFGADSLDVIEICIGLEDEFAISISDEEMDRARLVWEFVSLVDAKV